MDKRNSLIDPQIEHKHICTFRLAWELRKRSMMIVRALHKLMAGHVWGAYGSGGYVVHAFRSLASHRESRAAPCVTNGQSGQSWWYWHAEEMCR